MAMKIVKLIERLGNSVRRPLGQNLPLSALPLLLLRATCPVALKGATVSTDQSDLNLRTVRPSIVAP